MFGLFGRTYNSIDYIQKKTGFRCSELSRGEFDEMKHCGFRSNMELDPLGAPAKETAFSMIGEMNFLFGLYEARGDEQAMICIRDAIYKFLKEYKSEIPDYASILFSLPTDMRK